jgi:hypothetical protein
VIAAGGDHQQVDAMAARSREVVEWVVSDVGEQDLDDALGHVPGYP